MEKKLMKGNEAIAEGAIRAGCRFYAGYPITPQSEILEYMSSRMDEVDGVFIQGESEVASICMLWGAASAGVRGMTSSSGPGFSLKQEGIAYIASYEVPAVVVSVMRYGVGGGDITQGQDSYQQAVKGGGNGDYRLIVFAPNSVTECAKLTYDAFDTAEKYRNPALVLSDGAVGQMVELCELPEMKEHDINKYEWYIKGRPLSEPKYKATNQNWYIGDRAWEERVRNKYQEIMDNEQRWESTLCDDAELILVSYGVSSRVCKKAVKDARAKGIKIGLIRPITLWPYPRNAFEKLPSSLKGLMTVEMNITAQMMEDVLLATKCRYPVYDHCTAIDIPVAEDIVEKCKAILEGKAATREVL